MPGITSLIAHFEPIGIDATCGMALDRFLDTPDCDLLAVVEAGRPIGVMVRGSMLANDAERPVQDRMARALTVGADADLDQACDLILSHPEPVTGLVVVDQGRYQGVVSARALMRQMKQADAGAAKQRDRFLNMVSREVRTPIGGVLAVAQLLRRQPLSADSQAFVRTIVESCQATLSSLSDAIDLSRAEAGEMAFSTQPTQLRALMDAVQATWQERAGREGVTLLVAYDGEPELSGNLDAERVRQVFDKLVEAAMDGAGCRTVEVSLQARRTHDGLRLLGRVRDTGAGLLSEEVAASLGADHGCDVAAQGLRLGVSLCRQILEQLGGEIRAESNAGAGITVAFEFVVEETVVQAPSTFAETHGSRGAAHVLVVDDNATNRMVAEALCEMFDCTSECAEDGVEALEAARTGRFDVILMDIRMPRMDGVEATRAIRALPGAVGAVPIIALTANADPEDAQTYIDCGMHCVVEKPIKPERLLQALNAVLPAAAAGRVAA